MSPLPGSRPWLAATMTRTKSEPLEIVVEGDSTGSVPTYVQKFPLLELACGHGKKLIAKSIS